MSDTNSPRWRKASFSGVMDCVEVAPAEGGVLMRDSKDPHGPVLRLTRTQMSALADAFGGHENKGVSE